MIAVGDDGYIAAEALLLDYLEGEADVLVGVDGSGLCKDSLRSDAVLYQMIAYALALACDLVIGFTSAANGEGQEFLLHIFVCRVDALPEQSARTPRLDLCAEYQRRRVSRRLFLHRPHHAGAHDNGVYAEQQHQCVQDVGEEPPAVLSQVYDDIVVKTV